MALKQLTRLAGRSLARSARTTAAPAEPLQLLASWPAFLGATHSQQQLYSISEITGTSTGGTALQAANYGVAARQVHNDIETYSVSVVTGNVRGAGTNSAAFLQLVGSQGESEKVVIGNSHEDGLQRGSKVTFEVQVPQGIGPLRRVFIEREKSSCTDTGEGWYLEAVVVHGPHGEHYLFPCNSWFGHSDCGDYEGALERNLAPLVATDVVPDAKPRPVAVNVSGVAFPHPEKVIKNKIRGVNMKGFGYGGEDAYFYASAQSVFGMGVADGVYMWKELGIDSGTMARTLMETCQHMVAAGCEDVYKSLARALVPRSVTVALALPIAQGLEAPLAITAAAVLLQGILGANFGPGLMTRFGVKDTIARGLAAAGTAGGLGTASLTSKEPEALPFCALSYALVGIFSTVLMSVPAIRGAVIGIVG